MLGLKESLSKLCFVKEVRLLLRLGRIRSKFWFGIIKGILFSRFNLKILLLILFLIKLICKKIFSRY